MSSFSESKSASEFETDATDAEFFIPRSPIEFEIDIEDADFVITRLDIDLTHS
jgi:hypothetical protein